MNYLATIATTLTIIAVGIVSASIIVAIVDAARHFGVDDWSEVPPFTYVAARECQAVREAKQIVAERWTEEVR